MYSNFLSHIRTQRLSHAALRIFFAQSEVEVTTMANEQWTRLERDIAIIEQTLRAMIEIDHAVAKLPTDDAQQSTDQAILMR